MRTTVPILAALLALCACGQTASSGNNAAGHQAAANHASTAAPAGPVIRLPAVRGRPGSGYFEYRVTGDRGALLSVTSPQAGRVEMHETMAGAHNMMEMRPLARIPVRDGETLSFTPGGRHLMVYDLARTVAAGDRVDLILHFERGDPVTIQAVLQPVGGDI
jgi:periplasmic copper chaperone A